MKKTSKKTPSHPTVKINLSFDDKSFSYEFIVKDLKSNVLKSDVNEKYFKELFLSTLIEKFGENVGDIS